MGAGEESGEGEGEGEGGVDLMGCGGTYWLFWLRGVGGVLDEIGGRPFLGRRGVDLWEARVDLLCGAEMR